MYSVLAYNMGIVHPRSSTSKQITFFVIWNWYWTKLDRATSWKKIHFSTWELVEKNLPPSFFPIFSGTRQHFLTENKVFLEASICDVLMVKSLLGVDPIQSYGKNTKKPYPRFYRFCSLKIDFFQNLSQVSAILPYYCPWAGTVMGVSGLLSGGGIKIESQFRNFFSETINFQITNA